MVQECQLYFTEHLLERLKIPPETWQFHCQRDSHWTLLGQLRPALPYKNTSGLLPNICWNGRKSPPTKERMTIGLKEGTPLSISGTVGTSSIHNNTRQIIARCLLPKICLNGWKSPTKERMTIGLTEGTPLNTSGTVGTSSTYKNSSQIMAKAILPKICWNDTKYLPPPHKENGKWMAGGNHTEHFWDIWDQLPHSNTRQINARGFGVLLAGTVKTSPPRFIHKPCRIWMPEELFKPKGWDLSLHKNLKALRTGTWKQGIPLHLGREFGMNQPFPEHP